MAEWNNVPKNIKDYHGFVYLIRNKISGKSYIGSKNYWMIEKKPPLKGKKNKRHVKKETNWKDYWSSSNPLQEDIEKFGKENFDRHVLHSYETRFEVKYFEAKEQFDRQVLFKPGLYYNGVIEIKTGRCPKKLRYK
jgi:hypothetical protein